MMLYYLIKDRHKHRRPKEKRYHHVCTFLQLLLRCSRQPSICRYIKTVRVMFVLLWQLVQIPFWSGHGRATFVLNGSSRRNRRFPHSLFTVLCGDEWHVTICWWQALQQQIWDTSHCCTTLIVETAECITIEHHTYKSSYGVWLDHIVSY